MIKNKLYIIFIFFCAFTISFSEAAESIDGDFIAGGHSVKNKHSKIEPDLLDKYQGTEKQNALIAQFHDQNTKTVVFELNGDDISYVRSLKDRGASIEAIHRNLVQASVPASQLQAISDLPFVNYVRGPRKPLKDSVVSEGVGIMNATPLNNLGIRGQGVKIAVIDVGFAGYQLKLGSELPDPGNVTAISYSGDMAGSGETHGTAVAEIIYDIAPDAHLFLIKIGSDVEFLKAVDDAMGRNVDIITMSLGWLDGPFNGKSAISAKVDSAVSSGIVWVNSAGNYGQKHWEGKFIDADNDKIHDFAPGNENMSIGSGGNIELFLTWDDWPVSNQDYDLYIYNSTGYSIKSSTTVQDGTQKPVETISGNLPLDSYYLQIHKYNATMDVNFELYSHFQDIESRFQVPSSSLSIPADAQGAITVGAINFSNDLIEPFSSRGPTNDGRTKPEVVAPDGVQTSTLSPFDGTSASAPHVAGAAALLKSINSSLTPGSILSALQSSAKSLGDPNSSGAGKIDAWKAAVMVDKRSPRITITYPSDGKKMNLSVITVSGISSDNAGVNEVEVKVGTGNWQKASGTTSWNSTMTLSEGQNMISARAIDIAGNVQETSVNVTLDANLPAISIGYPIEGQKLNKDKIRINGTAYDNDILNKVEVRIGNNDWQAANGTTSWDISLKLFEGTNTISARTIDTAGNVQETSVNVTLDRSLPAIRIAYPTESQKLNTDLIKVNGTASDNDILSKVEARIGNNDWQTANGTTTWDISFKLIEGPNTIIARAIDAAGNINEIPVNIILDTTKPAVSDLEVSPSTQELNKYVDIKARISDNISLGSIFASVKSPDGNTSLCKMTGSTKSEIYNCNFINTSGYGRYNVTILASDLAGNINDTEKTWFVTTMKPYENDLVNIIANNIALVDALKEANTILEFVTSQDLTGTVKIIMSNDIPPEINQSVGSIPFRKFISVSISPGININLDWMNIRVYYTEDELKASGLDENSLRILHYNVGSRIWEIPAQGGANTSNMQNFSGFVWANASNLSTFALVGSYPVTQSKAQGSSSGGGGGGGGGGTSGEDFANIIVKEKYDLYIYKDIVTSYKFTNINNPILSINIVGNVNAGEIGTAVEVLRNTSSLVKTPAPGNVYKNVNVWVGTSGFGTSKNIKQAEITFRVENSWFSSNNMKSSSIKMVRWDGSKWNQLETSEKTKDSKYIYFETKTDGFSSFAVTGIENKEYINENVIIKEPNKHVAPTQTEEKKSDFLFNWFIIIGMFLAFGVIIEIYLRMKKK